MPSAAADTAIKTRLAASWTVSKVVGGLAAGDLPGNLSTPPTDVDAFLVVQYPVVNGEKPVLAGKFFEDGAARLVLNVKRDVGEATGLIWADTLATMFREYRPGGGFETFTPSLPIVNDDIDDGNWLELAIIVPYRYQFNG